VILPPPDDGRRRPFLVRYVLGNVHTRTAAKRLTLLMLVFVIVAVALRDAVLITVAVLGVVAYLVSIRWMDRHDAWVTPDELANQTTPDEPAE
jgi:hypothetical protein